MRDELRELWRYRELIGILVRRDLRVRYKNSVLGFLWSVVPMLLQTAVLTFLVKRIYHTGPPNMSAYLLCAYLPWTFFSISLLDATSSVIAQYGLLKKVYFPREALPIASVLSNLIHLGLALIVFFLYEYTYIWLMFGFPGLPPKEIVWLPAVILIGFNLALGVAFFTSAWNVFFEDIKFFVQSLLQLAFYLLPIIWFPEQLFYSKATGQWNHALLILYNANPVSWLITAFRQVLLPPAMLGQDNRGNPMLTAHFDYRYFLLALVTSFLITLAGYAYFNKRKWDFAERP